MGERGQGEPARVRLRDHVAEPALRDRPQPGGAGPDRGRVERWQRRGARRRARRGGARHRLGRVDPDSGGVLWRRRLQADLRPRLARRLLPARAELRPRRPNGAIRRRPAPRCSRRWPGVRARDCARLARRALGWRRLGRAAADPLLRARVEEAAARFGASRARSRSRSPTSSIPIFMREVADVHRDLYAEQRRPLRRERRHEGQPAASRSATRRSGPPSALARATASGWPRRSPASTCS